MENRNWPQIEWEKLWNQMRRARIRAARITGDKNFHKYFLADQIKIARENDYMYGKKAAESLSDILWSGINVLEIGPGLGALTIPFSKRVKSITALEISPKRAAVLVQELNKERIGNVEVLVKDWMKAPESDFKGKYDLVICSHFLWQVKDLKTHLEKMESASKGFCSIIQPSGRDAIVREAYEAIVSEPYQGQFEPDADIFPYIILRQMQRIPKTDYIKYTIQRDRAQLARYVASFLGKYIEIDKKADEVIAGFIDKRMGNDDHIEPSKAVVMWWKSI
jgi:ubiquinone/menaquinone biosynthesis C-methylase UbiE